MNRSHVKWTFPLCAALTLLCCSQALAAVGNLTVDAPKANGTVKVFVTDLNGSTITVNVPINGAWTAAQKAAAIEAAMAPQAIANGWATAVAGANISVTAPGNGPLIINFYPRGTREAQQQIVVPSNPAFRGGHGNMDPHAPTMSLYESPGMPATFTAGVDVGGTDYLVTLLGNNDLIDSDPSDLTLTATGSQIASALYSQLSALSLPVGVNLSLLSGTIDVDFAMGFNVETGIIWGTTSPTGDDFSDDGFNGSLSIVPEPSTFMFLALGALPLVWRWRRRRA